MIKSRLVPVFLAIGVTVGLDQWTKQLALAYQNTLRGGIDYLGGLFKLTFARNTGAFLSLGADFNPLLRTLLLEVFPSLLLVGLLFYIFRSRELNRWQVVALALIVGGGLSNIVDRLLYKSVVDMMQMQALGLRTGIFNVADMAIMAGMFMMLPYALRGEPKPADEEEAATTSDEEVVKTT